ncbi:hypothetical protein [Vibrio fluvialis]|uniref:hypothetical protein n=1 Tax=Vibrio fluvialis TaxID=676 RepID=UPI0012AE03D8|nr:hypothetical protein [Vibrio fluvialis]
MPTPIKGSEISFEGDTTTIIQGEGGKALRNGLVQKHALMIAELVQNGTIVRPSEITIDDKGRVVIENQEWTNVLKERMKNAPMGAVGDDPGFFDTNCSCGGKA